MLYLLPVSESFSHKRTSLSFVSPKLPNYKITKLAPNWIILPYEHKTTQVFKVLLISNAKLAIKQIFDHCWARSRFNFPLILRSNLFFPKKSNLGFQLFHKKIYSLQGQKVEKKIWAFFSKSGSEGGFFWKSKKKFFLFKNS